MGGNIESALYGAFSGAAFGGLNGFYGDAWSVGRVAANTAMGGTISRAMGGSFVTGAKFALVSSLAQWGFQGVSDETDRLKQIQCGASPRGCPYNRWGLDVIGTRQVSESPLLRDGNFWEAHPFMAYLAGTPGYGGPSMCDEGGGCHFYETWNEPWQQPFRNAVEYGIHLTSKVHDFWSEFDYGGNGLRVQGGPWANVSAATAASFEVGMNLYSFATMLPAAGYALGANASPYLLSPYARRRDDLQ